MICTAAGAVFSSALKCRCTQLRLIAEMLDEMSSKIRYRSLRISELMNGIAESPAYSGSTFVRCVSELMNSGAPVNEAWIKAAEQAHFFGEEERDILKNIGSQLGDSDTEGQLSMLSLGSTMLMRCLEASEKEYSDKSRMIMSVWTLCGIGAGIFII